MIDAEGYRANVAIIIINHDGKLFWGRRIRQKSWQFPQGGIHREESTLHALYRELHEEVGLRPTDVEIIAATPGWLKYRLPSHLVRSTEPICIGQKQKWFLLQLKSKDSAVKLDHGKKPEFDGWRWVSYWYPLSQIIPFKRHVYRRALERFHCYTSPQRGRHKKSTPYHSNRRQKV